MSRDDRKGEPDKPLPDEERSPEPEGDVSAQQRRQAERVETTLRVDYRNEGTFLFAYATNVSSLGIFIHTRTPDTPGTVLDLQFGPADEADVLSVRGEVVWINPYRPGGSNPNPGMGIRFVEMDLERRQRLVLLVRRIAYLEEAIRGTA